MTKNSIVTNASNEAQLRSAKQRVQLKHDRDIEDVRFVLETQQGRRFMWRLLEQCYVFRTSFTGNSTTFFNEGKRDIGLRVLADINEAAPDKYIKMMEEAKKDKENLNA